MPVFDVRFIKLICDDTGHEHATCQSTFIVGGASLGDALDKAETAFRQRKHIRSWEQFADYIELRRAPSARATTHEAQAANPNAPT